MKPATQQVRSSRLAGLLLGALGLVLTMAVLEAAFHAFWPQPLYAVQYAPWGLAHIPNVSFTHGHEAWYEHRWLVGTELVTHISYNTHGYRDYDRGYAKPADVARILVLGDSQGEGMEVQFSQSAPEVLERLLNAWLAAGNRGGPGHAERRANSPTNERVDVPAALEDGSYNWDATQAIFKSIRQTADEVGAGVLVLNAPVAAVIEQSQVSAWIQRKAFFEKIGIDTVDASDDASNHEALHFRFDPHWNAAGHARGANLAFQKIIDDRLLPFDGSVNRVEVINTSMSAYSNCKELMLLRAEGVRYEPDLVMVFYTGADSRNGLDRSMCTLQPDGTLTIHPQTHSAPQRVVRTLGGYAKSHSHFLTFVIDRIALVLRAFGLGPRAIPMEGN